MCACGGGAGGDLCWTKGMREGRGVRGESENARENERQKNSGHWFVFPVYSLTLKSLQDTTEKKKRVDTALMDGP